MIWERTDALDAAGNTTTAIIGKGFAIGSTVLVSLALLGSFICLLFGAMLLYRFSAMTMKSVGSAALKMVEVSRQFNTIPSLMEGNTKPDYANLCLGLDK
ncbi:hypothetical protein MKW92_010873 [Papaver armeniacum]|nr:hypothetical protein MKW92_010873 [Papaver armeniacum]